MCHFQKRNSYFIQKMWPRGLQMAPSTCGLSNGFLSSKRSNIWARLIHKINIYISSVKGCMWRSFQRQFEYSGKQLVNFKKLVLCFFIIIHNSFVFLSTFCLYLKSAARAFTKLRLICIINRKIMNEGVTVNTYYTMALFGCDVGLLECKIVCKMF